MHPFFHLFFVLLHSLLVQFIFTERMHQRITKSFLAMATDRPAVSVVKGCRQTIQEPVPGAVRCCPGTTSLCSRACFDHLCVIVSNSRRVAVVVMVLVISYA